MDKTKTRIDILSFLALTNYNPRFIKDYSKISKSNTEFSKDVPIEWNDETDVRFQRSKKSRHFFYRTMPIRPFLQNLCYIKVHKGL